MGESVRFEERGKGLKIIEEEQWVARAAGEGQAGHLLQGRLSVAPKSICLPSRILQLLSL